MIRRYLPAMGVGFLFLATGCREPSGLAPALPPGVSMSRVTADREEDQSEALGEGPTKESALPLPEQTLRKESLPDAVTPPTKPGETRTTKTGLQYSTTHAGKGPEAVKGHLVRVHYVGRLTDDTEFDASRNRPGGKPFEFILGNGDVILGWDEGVNGMLVGERRRLTVPPQLGYGAEGKGKIPPNATLIFEVELVGVQ